VKDKVTHCLVLQVNARNIDGATPLCDACNSGNIESVKTLLNSGADVNPKLSFFTTPLHEAVTKGKVYFETLFINDYVYNCRINGYLYIMKIIPRYTKNNTINTKKKRKTSQKLRTVHI